MNLSNDDQLKAILDVADPKIWELLQAVKENDVDLCLLTKTCHEIGEAKKSKRSVNIVVGKGVQEVLACKDDVLTEAMNKAGTGGVDLLRGLFLGANIRRMSGWGKVVYIYQDKKLVHVAQEQGYKVE
jgi:hypothetical protein